MKDFLTSRGHDVIMAKDGLEAYFKVHETPPDVVISDVVMPGLTGYQLCRLLKNDPNLSSIPIFLLTASSESLDKFWGKYSGADGYIQKDSKNSFEEIGLKLHGIERSSETKVVRSEDGRLAFGETLDRLFAEISLRGEVRRLFNHVEDMNYTVQKINNLLKELFEIEAMALLSISVDEMNLYSSVSDFELLEKWMLSKLSRPSYPRRRNHIRLEGKGEIKGLVRTSKVITFDSKEQGILMVWRDKVFSKREDNSLSIISEELGGILKIGFKLEEYRHNASFDELTSLPNYRSLEEKLRNLWDEEIDFTLSIIDIDHFKKVNDTYGHAIGNEVLSNIGLLLNDFAKRYHLFVARFGGEEFLLISEKNEGFFEIIEEIRQRIKKAHLSKSIPDLIVTVSAGIAARGNSKSFTEVVEKADQALYQAKESGRDRVCCY